MVSVRRSSSVTVSFTSTTRSFVTADDIEIDDTLIRELKSYEGEARATMLTAIAKEIHGLCALRTFVVEPLPDGRQPNSTKLVLKVKYKADGAYDKDKARLVA